MDQGVYARAFGVQSEASKVTVTRVACNEILYRRVVNTYRRDMNSTVNSIRREQKKLRGTMRSYRTKLYGEKKKKPYKYGWIANTNPDDDVDLRYQYNVSNDEKQQQQTSQNKTKQTSGKSHTDNIRDKDLAIGNTSISTHPNSLQMQVNAFLKAPNIKVKPKAKKIEDGEKKNKVKNSFGKERRLFRIGSGKIRSSEKTLQDIFRDEGDDDFDSLLPDSSDDERSVDGSIGTRKHRRSPSKRPESKSYGGLVYAKGAYFKPNDTAVSVEPSSDSNVASTIADGTTIQTASEKDVASSTGEPQLSSEANAEDPISKITLPSIPVINQREKTGAELTARDENIRQQPQTDSDKKQAFTSGKKDKPRKYISFGDIAKLHHGLKTKELFSLVDKLASRHGILGDVSNVDNHKDQPAPKSRNRNILKKSSEGEQKSSLTAHSSVFYAMKYGYGNDQVDSTKDTHLSPNPVSLKAKDQRLMNPHSATTDSEIDSEYAQTLSTRMSHVDIDEKRIGERSVYRNDTLLPLEINSTTHSNFSGRAVSESSPSCEQDDVVRSVQEVQAWQRHRGSRYQRQRRRASMLEASQFVNSLRNKKMDNKTSFSSEMGSFNKRRDSVMNSDENDMAPDMHKVNWSSAMSRIKLVHTLADLTHLI